MEIVRKRFRYARYIVETMLVNALVFSMLYQLVIYLANRRFWRQPAPPPPDDIPTISVIVPLRGKSLDTLSLLHRLVITGPTDEFEVLLVLEDETDPAYATAAEIVEYYPNRVRIILSGPAEAHIGKIHNLNAGYQAAQGNLIAFIDANTQMNAELWHAALAVMADATVSAAFAPPVVLEPEQRGTSTFSSGGEMLVALHANHARVAEIPLAVVNDRLRYMVSGFMIVRRAALDAAGGMLHLLDEAADDTALSRALTEAGGKLAAIPVPALVVAEPKTFNEATLHIQRKMITARATDLPRFVMMLFSNPLTVGSMLGLITEREGTWWGRRTWWVFVWLRLAVAYELDRIRLGHSFDWSAYAQLFMLDTFIAPTLWARAIIQDTFTWRGRTYRIAQGGKTLPGPAQHQPRDH